MVRDMLRGTPATPGEVDGNTRLLITSLYGVAIALMLYPLMDVIAGVVPVNFGSVQWRFGAVNFIAQTFWSQLLALGLTAAIGWLRGDARVLRTVAVICVLLVLAVVVLAALAALDFVQVRQMVLHAAKPKIDVAGGRLIVQLATSVLVAIPLGLGSWRAGQALRVSERKGTDKLGVVYSVGAKQSSRGAT